MKYILETARIKIREFVPQDKKFILELVNSPGWLKYIGDRNIKTLEQAENYLLNGPIKSYGENGFGLSMVELKDSEKPIGMCGILKRADLESPDIGFAFLPEFTRNGYAYESAKATLEYAQNTLNQKNIFAITIAENASSIRLLEKIGMKFIKTVQFPNQEATLMLFGSQAETLT